MGQMTEVGVFGNLQEKDRRFVVLFNEVNIGLTKSLNRALEKAQGKYIAEWMMMTLSSRQKTKRFLDKIIMLELLEHMPNFRGQSGFRMHDTGQILNVKPFLVVSAIHDDKKRCFDKKQHNL